MNVAKEQWCSSATGRQNDGKESSDSTTKIKEMSGPKGGKSKEKSFLED